MTLLRYVILFSTFFGVGSSFAAKGPITPEKVSQELVLAFSQGITSQAESKIVEKQYVGFSTRTVVFSLGKRIYRVVFSSDGTINIALTNEDGTGAIPLWTKTVSHTTLEEIVNFIYVREKGTAVRAAPQKSPKADMEADALAQSGRDLRWDHLMNAVLKGENLASDGNQDSLLQNLASARMLEPCSQNRAGLTPARSAMTQIVTAMASVLGSGLGKVVDRSREYEKHKSISILSELDKQSADAADLFHLISVEGSQAEQLFRAALRQSDEKANDPYAVAALRNFRAVAQVTGEGGQRLVGQVLPRTVLNLNTFNQLRKIVPKASVIYDRATERYYVDPTLTSPSQARYLLSVATFYEWKLQNSDYQKLRSEYEETLRGIATIEHAILDQSDERELKKRRQRADELSRKLFTFVQGIQQAARPSL